MIDFAIAETTAGTDVNTDSNDFSATDEWIEDKVQFPTKTDALLASISLEKDTDPLVVDKFLSLIKNPSFNPAECTLHSFDAVYSYASDYRRRHKKETRTATTSEATMSVPNFIWEEVISQVGSQWVSHVRETIRHVPDWGEITTHTLFERKNPWLLDLFSASLVHRTWTQSAQRQIGRVLSLENLDCATLESAVRSSIFGSWTQIILLKGSAKVIGSDHWGLKPEADTMSPNLPFLKSFFAHFPSVSTIYFESTWSHQPLTFFRAIKPPTSIDLLTVVNLDVSIIKCTSDIFMQANRWGCIKELRLAGVSLDIHCPDPSTQLPISESSRLSSIIVSGCDIHYAVSIQWIRFSKDVNGFYASGIGIRRTIRGPDAWFVGDTDPEDESPLDDESVCRDFKLPWLSRVQEVYLDNVYVLEANDVLGITTDLRHLRWMGGTFTPQFPLPASVRNLSLVVFNASDGVWHTFDRALHAYISRERSPGSDLQHIDIEIKFHHRIKEEIYPESEEEFPFIYFPRSTSLCTSLGIFLRISIKLCA